jgi:glyoxylase I family protein
MPALICRDVEETIRFCRNLLGFPLIELVENRDSAGSSHFYFDVGNRNLSGFFDFHETITGVQHIVLSMTPEVFRARQDRVRRRRNHLPPTRPAAAARS